MTLSVCYLCLPIAASSFGLSKPQIADATVAPRYNFSTAAAAAAVSNAPTVADDVAGAAKGPPHGALEQGL